ncbi:MAG: MFS transporter [Candidatus Aminicenantes bacterium]|nr:MFS transporter [Candidatus Aminicenantes bacterium]
MGYKFRLSFMMFLQYAIWGAWAPVLSEYLINDLGFSGTQVGVIYSLLPLATILSPFLGGQIADRYFPTEKVIAFLQLSGGALLIYTSFVSDYSTMMWLIFLYSLLYAPTLALTNSIAFINLKDSEKEFGTIRVWGTIGWIAAGLLLASWRMLADSQHILALTGDTLMLAGVFSVIMGFQSFGLPHTPPKKEVKKPWAFLEAIKMLKDNNLAIFIGITFIVATELQFYYILTAPYLTSGRIGIKSTMVSGVMVIAQVAEIFVMAALLPYFLPKFGIKKTMIIGVLAWPLRYIIFVIGQPVWLVIASLSLHGFCYVFFFTAAFIYIDKVAPKDIRASAQSLIAIVTLGLGNFLGSLFAGWIQTVFTQGAVTNWKGVFVVPSVLTILCAVVFILFFKEKKKVHLD